MKRSSPHSSTTRFSNNNPLRPAVIPTPEEDAGDSHRRLGLQRMAAATAAGAGLVPTSSSWCLEDYLLRPLRRDSTSSISSFSIPDDETQLNNISINNTAGGGTGGARGDKTITETEEEDIDESTLLLAQAINHLSLREREQAYEDLHGVSETVQETPELIAQSIHTMKQHLATIPNKPAHDLAITMDDAYVHDSKLLLMFLRADRFDARAATKRFITWLDWKFKLFGKEKLCQRNLYFNDLDEDTRNMVESGLYQVLPTRDSCGRVVVVLAANHLHRLFRTTQSILQMFFYMNLCIMQEDDYSQKNGMVIIIYSLGEENDEDVQTNEMRDSVLQSSSMISCMPFRIEAMHNFLRSDTMLRQYAFTLVVQTINRFLRARARIHFGSHLECGYALLSFGIPSALLPLTTEGELKRNNHKKWIQRRIVRDYEIVCNLPTNPNYIFSGIELPNRNDVLLGQGIPRQTHPGNQRLSELIEYYLEEYNQASLCKDQQRAVVLKVLEKFKNTIGGGGRFLKLLDDQRKSGWWEEETKEKVLSERVRNGFRNARVKRRTQKPTRTMASTTVPANRKFN